jgi:hypothetical protein
MLATDRFRIVLNPKLACKSDAPESLDYVEVVASRDGPSIGRHKRDLDLRDGKR